MQTSLQKLLGKDLLCNLSRAERVLACWTRADRRLHHRERSFRRVLVDRIVSTKLLEDWRVPFCCCAESFMELQRASERKHFY